MTTPTHAVVVAVGAGGVGAALAFAASEAVRTARPLHLVHVLQLPAGEAYVGAYGGLLDQAKVVLEDAREQAEKLAAADVPVTAELVDHGWVVQELVARSVGASLLVLQHRALNPVRRLWDGSIAQSVAGRAHVPVVSVPESWSPQVDGKPVVLAGVQDPVDAPVLLRAAFEEARDRRARLVVLHAWWLANAYDNIVVDGALREEWSARSRQEIATVLEPLEQEFFAVRAEIEVRHGPPAQTVLDRATEADLLVLGRRHHLLPLGSHLGPVARAAISHAPCPVLITPELTEQVAVADGDLAASV